MKRLNLDETWEQCLKMWKWIAGRVSRGDSRPNFILKNDWMHKHIGDDYRLFGYDCFFCEYSGTHLTKTERSCNCPGMKIDKSFDCMDANYDFANYPIKFYKELVRLNKIRLARKAKK